MFCLLFGLLKDNPFFLYYQYLCLLYSVTMIKDYINNNKFLHNYPSIKELILKILDALQTLLLCILLGIISDTLISYLKSV